MQHICESVDSFTKRKGRTVSGGANDKGIMKLLIIKYNPSYLLVYIRWCNLCLGNITLNGINLSWFGLFKRIHTNVTATLASQRPPDVMRAKLKFAQS